LAFSLFLQNTDDLGPRLLEQYRTNFVAGPELTAARVVLAVSAVCFEDSAMAQKSNVELIKRGYYPSNLVGTPAQCRSQLRKIVQEYGATEIVVATWLTSFESRVKIYELIAKAVMQD
jgi:alkanesulfonate monooxygenase SsuD/methylene tetrahydromethanopterin reductase-like flavin-dependent oxidoreductase (luciferase family)